MSSTRVFLMTQLCDTGRSRKPCSGPRTRAALECRNLSVGGSQHDGPKAALFQALSAPNLLPYPLGRINDLQRSSKIMQISLVILIYTKFYIWGPVWEPKTEMPSAGLPGEVNPRALWQYWPLLQRSLPSSFWNCWCHQKSRAAARGSPSSQGWTPHFVY